MQIGFIVLLVLVVVVVFFVFTFASKRQDGEKRFKKKQLMTENEKEFFERLCLALPDFHIFPQVAAGALLDTIAVYGEKDGNGKSKSHSARGKFSQKIVDYVICDKTFNVLAIVELDDRTHASKRASDQDRDKMMNEAGYPVVRWQ